MNYIPFYCILGFAVIVTALFLIWRDPAKPAMNSLLKGISSFAFMVLALVCTFMNEALTFPVLFILIGLTASIFGDLYLAGKDFKDKHEEGALFAGFGSFCVTQIMYLLGLIFLYGFTWWSFLIGGLLTLMLLLSEKMLKLNFDKFRIIVAIYSWAGNNEFGFKWLYSCRTTIYVGCNILCSIRFDFIVYLFQKGYKRYSLYI